MEKQIIREKFRKDPILRKMNEFKQSKEQNINYLRYLISIRLNQHDFELFDILARAYNLYYLMIFSEAFELIRLNFHEYLVIVQKTPFEYIIEIRKK